MVNGEIVYSSDIAVYLEHAISSSDRESILFALRKAKKMTQIELHSLLLFRNLSIYKIKTQFIKTQFIKKHK